MDSDEDDFVFYGTPIAREEEITRKQKALAEASGQLRTLPAWKQEVTDEEGRRRFHGAFTGGFSAGYYNTVGSKEGWTPQSFTSSRKNRAEFQKQDILNFLDEDEKAELDSRSLGTNMHFDTFGFTATELARKEAEKEQQRRPSAIPGPIPDEMVAPVTESIGVKLLLKMGWRRGRSIKESSTNSLSDIRKDSSKSFLPFSADDTEDFVESSELVESDAELIRNLPTSGNTERFSGNTPVYVLNPKQNLHGLGYDPFKNAPEFRDKRISQASGASERFGRPSTLGNSLFGVKSGRVAPGFGIGALEDLDAEDEDVYNTGYHFEDSYVEEIEEPTIAMIDNVRRLEKIEDDGVLAGFKAASNCDYQRERYDPPVIPKDFVPHHKFTSPYDPGNKFAEVAPPETPHPEDNSLKILIDGMASLVARCGKLFEDLSREKHQANPLFGFLFGGEGHDYYVRKLWEEQQKHRHNPQKRLNGQTSQDAKKMSAESRGKILGEKTLERSITNSAVSVSPVETINLQFHLADTFTKPASLSDVSEVSKPFRDDPAKQERFEQFLKEKYHGGLRSKDAGGAGKMSEAARARERLEFEAAADAIEKGKRVISKSKISSDLFTDVLTTSELQFTSGVQERAKFNDESVKGTRYPRREEFQWRPAPILSKRFDLIDPFMGKPPPAPRARSKMDTLLFVADPAISSKLEKEASPDRNLSSSLMSAGDKGSDAEAEAQVEVGTVERPVDLYKAIFSDDSDDDEENNNPSSLAEEPQKKTEVVNRTVNRLIAGDFLESLGKELGLEVPPDLPYSEDKVSGAAVSRETRTANQGEKDSKQEGKKRLYEDNAAVNGSLMTPNMPQSVRSHEQIVQEERSLNKHDVTNSVNTRTSVAMVTAPGTSEKTGGKDKKAGREEENAKTVKRQHQNFSESSEDERIRKHSCRRHRSNSPDGDTSDSSDASRHHRSRSKRKKKKSSEEKSSSRRHSKHCKNRHKDSPERDSRYGSGREHREAKDRRR